MGTEVILVLFGLLFLLSEQLIVYRELYVSKVLAADLADMVMDLKQVDGNIKYGVLD